MAICVHFAHAYRNHNVLALDNMSRLIETLHFERTLGEDMIRLNDNINDFLDGFNFTLDFDDEDEDELVGDHGPSSHNVIFLILDIGQLNQQSHMYKSLLLSFSPPFEYFLTSTC